jgi:hypothetical protein
MKKVADRDMLIPRWYQLKLQMNESWKTCVKVYLCLIKHKATKTYGREKVYLNLFITLALD